MMKRAGKWFLSVVTKAVVMALVIMIVLFAADPLRDLIRNVRGEIEIQSSVLKQKMESSKRLEVTTIDEEGTLEATTSVIIFGTVGSTVIRYRYTASLGIDLSKVIMDTEVVLCILRIVQLVISKRDITYSHIKEVIRKLRFFKSVNPDFCLWI